MPEENFFAPARCLPIRQTTLRLVLGLRRSLDFRLQILDFRFCRPLDDCRFGADALFGGLIESSSFSGSLCLHHFFPGGSKRPASYMLMTAKYEIVTITLARSAFMATTSMRSPHFLAQRFCLRTAALAPSLLLSRTQVSQRFCSAFIHGRRMSHRRY